MLANRDELKIYPNRAIAFAACIGIVLVCWGLVYGDMQYMGMAPWLSALTIGLIGLEAVWRFDLRPVLVADQYGVLVVRPFTQYTSTWSNVQSLGTSGNELHIATESKMITFEFDRIWWIAKLNPEYADRGIRYCETLDGFRRSAEVGEPPASKYRHRPYYFHALLFLGILILLIN